MWARSCIHLHTHSRMDKHTNCARVPPVLSDDWSVKDSVSFQNDLLASSCLSDQLTLSLTGFIVVTRSDYIAYPPGAF